VLLTSVLASSNRVSDVTIQIQGISSITCNVYLLQGTTSCGDLPTGARGVQSSGSEVTFLFTRSLQNLHHAKDGRSRKEEESEAFVGVHSD
jgi:hypothetical protein